MTRGKCRRGRSGARRRHRPRVEPGNGASPPHTRWTVKVSIREWQRLVTLTRSRNSDSHVLAPAGRDSARRFRRRNRRAESGRQACGCVGVRMCALRMLTGKRRSKARRLRNDRAHLEREPHGRFSGQPPPRSGAASAEPRERPQETPAAGRRRSRSMKRWRTIVGVALARRWIDRHHARHVAACRLPHAAIGAVLRRAGIGLWISWECPTARATRTSALVADDASSIRVESWYFRGGRHYILSGARHRPTAPRIDAAFLSPLGCSTDTDSRIGGRTVSCGSPDGRSTWW